MVQGMVDIELGNDGSNPEVDENEQALLASLLQPVTEGSCCLILNLSFCCLIGVVAPVILFAHLGAVQAPEDQDLIIVLGCVGIGIGILLSCCVLWRTVFLPKPPKPAAAFPLVKAPTTRKPRKLYVLVNPKGGTKGAQAIYDKFVKPGLDAGGIEHQKIETEYAGHGKVLCNTLPIGNDSGFDAIVAIGGDGTFHECVNGMLDRTDGTRCPIGLIPGGSGNSFLTDFGLGKDPKAAIDNIVAGRLAGIDATRCVFGPDEVKHHLWSINVIGYCADHCMGAVNIDGWRGCLGPARYDICALWGLLKGRTSREVSVKVDGSEWTKGVGAVFINTTQHFGKGMRAAPEARLDDGLADVGSIKGSISHSLRLFSLIKTGQHAALSDSIQAKEIEIVVPEELGVFNLDGEVVIHRRNNISMTVHPAAFEFFVPDNDQWQRIFKV